MSSVWGKLKIGGQLPEDTQRLCKLDEMLADYAECGDDGMEETWVEEEGAFVVESPESGDFPDLVELLDRAHVDFDHTVEDEGGNVCIEKHRAGIVVEAIPADTAGIEMIERKKIQDILDDNVTRPAKALRLIKQALGADTNDARRITLAQYADAVKRVKETALQESGEK